MIFSIFVTFLWFASCKTSKTADSVKTANQQNEEKAKNGMVDNDAALFLVKIADARMMGAKEGALAVSRGTTNEIKNYGKLMVKDQGELMAKIKIIAKDMNISLPKEISADKKDGLKGLEEKNGEAFDEKFCKMMKIDHERDVKDFTAAIEKLKDSKAKTFAVSNLPVIQMHLDGINELKKSN